MSALEVNFSIPYVFIKTDVSVPRDNRKLMKTLLIPSMIASTLMVAILTTFVPQLMPIWMSLAATRPLD